MRCDPEGNLYFRVYSKEFDASPVESVSLDGKRRSYSIRAVEGFQKAVVYDFTAGSNGEVLFLVARQPNRYEIVRLDRDAKLHSSFVLTNTLDPRQVAAFPSGDLLVSGLALSETEGHPTGEALTAIYNRAGRLVREVSLPRDIRLEEGASGSDALDLTTATAAEDGNVYLMRPGPAVSVYAVSPLGQVLKRFRIRSNDEGFRPTYATLWAGRIMILFEESKPKPNQQAQRFFSVHDHETGEHLFDYFVTPEVRGAFGCTSGDALWFLTAEGDQPKLTLVRAAP